MLMCKEMFCRVGTRGRMRFQDEKLILSASDLMRFMGCAHATALDLAHIRGEGPEPATDSAEAELLQARGDAHEASYLARLREEGREVAEIAKDGIEFEAAVAQTREALAKGPEVVFQAALAIGAWGGYTDFLERVERTSSLGPFSYEVVDTKLKRRPDPKHVLQLVVYSDLLAGAQGEMPEHAHLELGSGERVTLRLQDYAAYARHAQARLEAFVSDPPPTRPEPCAACPLCRWREHCQAEWERTDSLALVAGITASQRHKLEAADVTTMAALAGRGARVPRLADETLGKLRIQARLQMARRGGGPPDFAPRPIELGRGFDRLPEPDAGDLFFDMEGDPYHEGGLEYLFGLWLEEDGVDRFRAFWAHDREEERAAFEQVIACFSERLRRFPKAHIYHYAAYEVTALRRLAMQHGVGEAALDQMLREGRFVDLYAVVRGALFASEPGYSIKDLEAFYMPPRAGAVKTAGGSVVAYEKWRESRAPEILEEIRAYNEIDCISTRKLRDWLVATVRPRSLPWPANPGAENAPEREGDERVEEEEKAARALRTRLEAVRERLGEDLARLLFDLSCYHAREKRPAWWSIFDRAGRETDELVDDLDCLAGLQATDEPRRVARSWERSYRYPDQETKLRVPAQPTVMTTAGPRTANLVELDPGARTAVVKFGTKHFGTAPDRVNLLPAAPIGTAAIEDAIARAVNDLCSAGGRYGAVEELLLKAPPRFRTLRRGPIIPGRDVIPETVAAIADLDHGVLPIQGPPGTGKTFVSSCAILQLARQGMRVAVASNSHKAIDNLLFAVLDRAIEANEEIDVVKKIGEEIEGPYGHRIEQVTDNGHPSLSSAAVVGGTAWLFSRPDFDQTFDYLFVDEAGQVSLANIVAMGTAARNIVLVGDPMQLPQVVQGSHPEPAGTSALEYLLAGHNTVPPERGIFLPRSRRMHPDVCRFISEQVYESRLASDEGAARQVLIGLVGLPASGAHLVEVAHQGNSQSCPEEVSAISTAIRRLLGTIFRDRDGRERPLGIADILVVAPYNAQVNALAAALPRGARVGTVDRFQGQEAPVCLVSMTTSSGDELPRDVDFLFSLNRVNVAVSRAQVLSLVFASPRLLEVPCQTIEQMRLVNTLCALRDYGRRLERKRSA